jgi:tRNA (mo5U34)-methyltransferase
MTGGTTKGEAAAVSAPGGHGDLAHRAADVGWWYHSIDLAPGVTTPGWFDTRTLPTQIGFPADLRGQRCLDIGTFDGFWAFTMERHGATDVIAIDVPDPAQWDWPALVPKGIFDELTRRRPGAGFRLAAEALGSRAERLEKSVHDLDPADLGTFDFVYMGSLLVHLRDPVGALMRVRRVCTGSLLLVEPIHLGPTVGFSAAASLDAQGRPWWWKPNIRGLVRMVEAAGFVPTAPPARVRIKAGPGQGRPPLRRGLRNRGAREAALIARFGDPHAAVLARPGPGAAR